MGMVMSWGWWWCHGDGGVMGSITGCKNASCECEFSLGYCNNFRHHTSFTQLHQSSKWVVCCVDWCDVGSVSCGLV